MSSKVLLSWDSLVVGEKVGVFENGLGPVQAKEFRSIVDPDGNVYADSIVPSLAFDTLHAVKEFIELPQGTVHSKEAVHFHGAALTEEHSTVEVFVADKSVRRGKRNFTLECRIYSGSDHLLTAFKSFVVPGESHVPESAGMKTFDFGLFSASTNLENQTARYEPQPIEFTVVQSFLDDFGRATATDGPIHSDPVVATAQFGGTILQGMYLFELASQIMARFSSPEDWMSEGKLAAKFVGSAITGERVTVSARMRPLPHGERHIAHCSIEARTSSGKTILVAEAQGPLSAPEYVKEIKA